MNYYNDFDKNAAQWLRNLITAGLLPQGDVDDRPIQEVQPHELTGYTQCHFFAGIGGWPLALQLAGVGANRPLWTGSCPCQPYSVAGKGLGDDDERNLWPEYLRLIKVGRPAKAFGEQVASKDGRNWFAGVRSDLEALGYAVGGADLCAAGIKAEASVLLAGRNGIRRERVNLGPAHIRQRLYWVADAERSGSQRRSSPERCEQREIGQVGPRGAFGRVADSDSERWDGINPLLREGQEYLPKTAGGGISGCGMADTAHSDRWSGEHGAQTRTRTDGERRRGFAIGGAGSGMGDSELCRCGQDHSTEQTGTNATDIRGDFALIPCGDGKARRIEPGLMPLVDGLPARVAQIRGYGNAIHPGLAAEFIKACFEAF